MLVPLSCVCVSCVCVVHADRGESASRPARVCIRGGDATRAQPLIRWLAVCGRARGHCDQVRDIGPGRSSGELLSTPWLLVLLLYGALIFSACMHVD